MRFLNEKQKFVFLKDKCTFWTNDSKKQQSARFHVIFMNSMILKWTLSNFWNLKMHIFDAFHTSGFSTLLFSRSKNDFNIHGFCHFQFWGNMPTFFLFFMFLFLQGRTCTIFFETVNVRISWRKVPMEKLRTHQQKTRFYFCAAKRFVQFLIVWLRKNPHVRPSWYLRVKCL